jgi:hypothetical protein
VIGACDSCPVSQYRITENVNSLGKDQNTACRPDAYNPYEDSEGSPPHAVWRRGQEVADEWEYNGGVNLFNIHVHVYGMITMKFLCIINV